MLELARVLNLPIDVILYFGYFLLQRINARRFFSLCLTLFSQR